MKEYRIVKETTTNTNITRYYTEQRKKFLIWEWWTKNHYVDIDFELSHSTYKGAKYELDRLTDNIIREVVE